MGKVTVKINEQTYHLACRDGEESRLQSLAAYVDKKMGEIAASLGPAGDIRVLLMTALVITDELMECRERLGDAASAPAFSRPSGAESPVLDMITNLTNKIEHIAARLEKA